MPIYEYECKDCGHRLEALQKISAAPLQECPQCSRNGLTRLVSASSFRLKGGGWYETDFKTGNKRHGTADAPDASKPSTSAAPESGASGKEKPKETKTVPAKEAAGTVKSTPASTPAN